MVETEPSVRRTFTFRKSLVDRLDRYRARTGISRTFAVQQALQEYLDRREPALNGGEEAERG